MLLVVFLGHTHDQGRVQGHGVTDGGGRAVEVTAGRGEDIVIVEAIPGIIVAAGRNIIAAAAANHRDEAAVARNATTTTRNREVVVNR